MSVYSWTLKAGVITQSAAQWGLTGDPILEMRTQGPSVLSWPMIGADPAGAVPIAYSTPVLLQYLKDGNPIYTFSGRQTSQRLIAMPNARGIGLVFQDAWFDLENLVYRQQWNIYSDATHFVPTFFSRAFLFLNTTTGAPLPVNQQIANIINYARNQCGVNIQVGTIDPGFAQNVYPIRGMSCADAIKKCLELIPDCVTWIDGSTNPPTFNARQRKNLAVLALPWGGTDAAGRSHKSSEITPRYDLQAKAVVIEYQTTITINGNPYVNPTTDSWNGVDASSTGTAIGDLVIPIDLRGGTFNTTQSTIQSQNFAPGTLPWWQAKIPALADARVANLAIVDATINTGSPYGVTVKDTNGNLLNIAGLYEYVKGPAASWITVPGGQPLRVIEAVVTANFTYDENLGPGGTTSASYVPPAGKTHHTRIKLTNSPPTQNNVPYTNVTGSQGEAPVAGLSKAYFDSITQLQYDGLHSVLEQSISQVIDCRYVLNLRGGNAAWAVMNANIAEVKVDFFNGETNISIGPAKHVSIQDLSGYMQFWRGRLLLESWQTPFTGRSSGAGANVDIGNDEPKQDSMDGLTAPGLTACLSAPDGAGNQVAFLSEPNIQTFSIAKVNGNLVPLATSPVIALRLSDMPVAPAGKAPLIAQLREYPICVMVAGVPTTQYVMLVGTQVYPNQGSPYT